MRHYQPRVMAVWLFTFAAPLFCQGDNLFSSPEQKPAFDKALAARDSAYDPAEKMIRRPLSSPGYTNIALMGTYVTITAKDLRIRLQFEGPIDNLTIAPHPPTIENPGARHQPLGGSIELRPLAAAR